MGATNLLMCRNEGIPYISILAVRHPPEAYFIRTHSMDLLPQQMQSVSARNYITWALCLLLES